MTSIVSNAHDLKVLREKLLSQKEGLSRESSRMILVCAGGGCIASGSPQVKTALQEALEKKGLQQKVSIVDTGCMGPCVKGPIVLIAPDQTFYQNVSPEDALEIVESHIENGVVVERLICHDDHNKPLPLQMDLPFFQKQTKIVLRNCGVVDPLAIEDYICRDGYDGLAKALAMPPDQVVDEVKQSGLRGRGGAGFPTWLKWNLTRKSESDMKYVLCNADEGDPGAFMDRSVLEGDPHSIIEGMAIAAYAIGASQGYVYVRAEYPLAVERLEVALGQARKLGVLGENILGTEFSFDLEVRMGSGAFVCGEETALMTSIEGKRGEPRPRPPFPAQKGLWDKPTVLNNVETYANVPAILKSGAGWYSSFGTEKSKGTKVFALAGSVNNTGLVEVPVGTTLGELIYDIGGGICGGKAFKAAQIGGPSGGCVPKQHLNVPLDYESLNELGAIMGSGGLIVMDEDTCMVDVARFFLEFVQEESCGKCVPCRVGTKRMLEILENICSGEGQEGDIERLIELGNNIKDTALCGLGQTAPNPVLSTIRHFRHEYEAHIEDRHCEAGVCPSLVRAPCQSACPAGVDVPGFVSLVGEKRYAEALRLHRERNPFAAVCARVCFHTCEDKCRRSTLDDPVMVRGIKRFMVDQEVTIQLPEVLENEKNAERKIAIIGAGPAGLSCAYFLARLGYKPKILEAEPRPGGMLVQSIPAYRLPREVLAREVRMIENMGVDIETDKRLGRDFTLASLRDDGYEAVFVGVGAQAPVNLGIGGEESEGVVDALDFLRQYNLRGSVPVGKKVVVIGGGNAAVDAARTALRLGAETVTIVYRRTREQMPAYAEEIEEAQQEGVDLRVLTAPVEVVATDGKVSGLVCRPMTLGQFDRSGRRRPEGETGHDFTIETDQIITAVGQKVATSEIFDGIELDVTKSGTLAIDKTSGQTSVPWVFAGGDVVLGAASVIEAVAAGERAAVGIDMFFTKESHAFWREEREVHTSYDPDSEPAPYPREKLHLIAVDRRRNNFDEVEMAWNESVTVRQAKRCLRCDYGKTPAKKDVDVKVSSKS
ncbi:MAG: NADH-quinone oxidoreductase subunit NuoF [Chitinispirillaceae bacterium]